MYQSNFRTLKVGDTIKCLNQKDVKQVLAELSKAGYGAVSHWPSNVITITKEPWRKK